MAHLQLIIGHLLRPNVCCLPFTEQTLFIAFQFCVVIGDILQANREQNLKVRRFCLLCFSDELWKYQNGEHFGKKAQKDLPER